MNEALELNHSETIRISAMSELMTLAAVFIEYRLYDSAHLTIKRIQQLVQGKEIQCFTPNLFTERMAILLKATERLRR